MNEKRVNVEKLKKCVRAPLKNSVKEEEAWRFYDITNCYSYAIGMFFDIDFLKPGEISDMELKSQYTDEDILERVVKDLECLGLEVTKSTLEEKVEGDDTWKIAVMNTGLRNVTTVYDYHFLKQGANMLWYHKRPYDQFPSNYDSRHRVINNPETAVFAFDDHLVAYLSVRFKK